MLAKRICFFILIAIAVLAVVFPYLRVEYLTLKYGEQFDELYKLTNMIDGVCLVKVFAYSENHAKVYYIESGRLTGSFVYFFRDEKYEEWTLETWKTVWSKSGSAEGFVWPYY